MNLGKEVISSEKYGDIKSFIVNMFLDQDKNAFCPCFLSWLLSIYEPRSEKTGLRGFRPGPTQTGLCNHRRWLEA